MEENIQGTKKQQLKGQLLYSKPTHGMAWLWQSVFKRRRSWDRKKIKVSLKTDLKTILAVEFFFQMNLT